ncbi:ATP-dependent helicase HrpB [Pseudonocardiaceae bacterium YIM PH 21723]|nr:ATP-dependent helicase HrpB [Pseudonocardiaceae bacterium YIM PH 21723]
MPLPDLPIRPHLEAITEQLTNSNSLVLVAPPGTGKTTLVPLALLTATTGKIVVAEPRRLAARAAAGRMAAILGEPVGRTVGYAVRGDRKTSKDTRIEVVTSGLLVRRLQSDPELPGTDVVLLDECHERHLDADLLLALLLDTRAALRPDLKILATSATVATGRLNEILDAPVLAVDGSTYPVQQRYLPPNPRERLEHTVARAIRAALSESDGDVLAFLPGAGEIRRTAALLTDLPVFPLHGRLSTQEQDAALRPGGEQRVILSTAVAESSLTVPGVRAVVDSGMARTSRMDHRRGLAGLVTIRVSAAVADQRTGRAGRQGPGIAYRCWPEHEQSTLPRYPEPEIATTDLTSLALQLACWGSPDGSGLTWWDAPPPGPLAAGRETLTALSAVDDKGNATSRGREINRLGLHPRLGRALLDGAPQIGSTAATEVVALLDGDIPSGDLQEALRSARREHQWQREVSRLSRLIDQTPRTGPADPALILALAYPEWLARRREAGSRTYLMAGGTAVDADSDAGEWLAIGRVDREPGRAHGRIRLAARADRELAERAAPGLLSTVDEVFWDNDVVARRITKLGQIVLKEQRLTDPPRDQLTAALLDGLRSEGLELLRWTSAAIALNYRLAFLHRNLGAPWPDMDRLLDTVQVWLGPELAKARKRADLERADLHQALSRLLPWPEAARMDELAPERLAVPSGSRITVDYSGDKPVLAVKLQETFGWIETPTLAGVPVLLHLLSPAGRPVAVTGDLASFWRDGYRQVRGELRGRYPKHPWPEDPLTATATRRANPRR